MKPILEYLFDVGSAASYLAWTQLPRIAAQTNAQIVMKPVLLGGVFKATGNSSPMTVPAKGVYTGRDFARFAARYGVPAPANPYFPINTMTMMRIATGLASSPDRLKTYLDAVFDGIWVQGLNMGDVQVLSNRLTIAGLDAPGLLRLADDDAIKAELRTATDAAVARGMFGAPTFFVGSEMFFGQDRFDFIVESLSRQSAGA